MTRYIAVLALAVAGVTVVASGCSESAAPPATITLQVRLANAGFGDQAMLVQVVGTDTARIDTLTAPVGSRDTVYAQRQSNTAWRAIIVGNLSDGAVLRLLVPGRSRASAYAATILDVANASFADVPPGARALTVTP